MDAQHGLAVILRDARYRALLRMRRQFVAAVEITECGVSLMKQYVARGDLSRDWGGNARNLAGDEYGE